MSASPRKTNEKPKQPKAPRPEIQESDIPDVIPHVPKPDKAAHDAACAKIDAEIKKLQDRSNAIRKELDAIKEGRTGYGPEIQDAKAVWAELRTKKDNLLQQRNQLNAKLKQLLDKRDDTVKQQRAARSTLKFHTEAEIEQEIAKLRHQQETRSMSLNEEKKIVKEIEALQQSKQQVAKIAEEKGDVDTISNSIKDLKAQVTKKSEEVDAAFTKMKAQQEKLNELYKLNEQEKQNDKFPVLVEERKQLKVQIDAKYTEVRALRAAFKEANDQYFHNIRLVRKKRELERQKEEERKRAEYEAKLAEYEKEMAKIHPYQDEMDLCDALVAFLEKTFAKELTDANESGDAASTAAPELDGMKPLQRKEEDFMVLGGGKKGKKGKRDGPKKSKKDAKVSLPLAQTEAFSSIGLMPPATVGALTDALKAIKDKKTWYTKQTTRPQAAATKETTAAPAATAKLSPKKKTTKKASLDSSAFPSLGGLEASLPAQSTMAWGPGMAPPAPVAMASADDEDQDFAAEDEE